jgi:hypothetical protein
MTDCSNHTSNLASCACTYAGCPRRGKCCECLHYHLGHQELPGCCFPPEVERTYDRSFRRFAELHGGRS